MVSLRTACAAGLVVAAVSGTVTAGSLSLPDGLAALPGCALGCFQTAVPMSGCNMTDVGCLCPSNAFRNSATACVHEECTVRDALSAQNITSLLCSDPEPEDSHMYPVLIAFICIADIAVALRILARVLTKAYFWWDDWFNLCGIAGCTVVTALALHSVNIGMGKNVWVVPPEDVTQIMMDFFINMLMYTITRFLVRASAILFYIRVFPPSPNNKIAGLLRWTLWFNLAYNLSFFFAVVFHCQPVQLFWKGWLGETTGHCGNVNLLIWLAATTGIAFDIWLLVLPFPQLFALNLHWKKKIMGMLMFGVGVCVLIVSLIRLKTINQFTSMKNPSMDILEVTLWSAIEIDIGVVCPCLPSFRLLFRRILPRMMDSTDTFELGRTDPGMDRMTGTRTVITAGRRGDANSPSRGKNSHDESHDGGSFSGSVTGLVVTQNVEIKSS